MAQSDDEVLETVARGETMDFEFPPPPGARSREDPGPAAGDGAGATDQHDISTSRGSSQGSHTDKENAPPPVDRASSSHDTNASGGRRADDANHLGTLDLPPSHASVFNSIRTTLTTSFKTAPPHTIQRVAELILRPRAHYRFLGPYLRALDRVVSVSSGADVFPLVADRPGGNHASNSILPNGTNSGPSWSAILDGDESLGGALLTPIPWLQQQDEEQDENQLDPSHEDGVNGIDGSEGGGLGMHGIRQSHHQDVNNDSFREAGAVTHEELIRQQQEAGELPTPEPIGRHPRSPTAARSSLSSSDDPNAMEIEDHPHASGPEEVGLEDTGPQDSGDVRGRFDVDVALGRKTPHVEETMEESSSTTSTDGGSVEETPPSSSAADDIMVTDADGNPTDDNAGID
ncbi:MAG: Nitrogen permease regulator 2 [Watsoniomyces obsoletus]|nr:MAG: Nitrogen permease regulator 2 [Watsoniomyces obsoletus]